MSPPKLGFPHQNSAHFAFSALNFNHPLSNTNSVCSMHSGVNIYVLPLFSALFALSALKMYCSIPIKNSVCSVFSVVQSFPCVCAVLFIQQRNLLDLWSYSFLCSSRKKRLNLASIPHPKPPFRHHERLLGFGLDYMRPGCCGDTALNANLREYLITANWQLT